MNAGTAHITNLSPYYVRTSFSMWQAGYAMGEAAAKILNAKTAVVGYTDFPPGKDSLAAFKRGFEGNGGKVIDEIPMGGAGAVPDFTPFFQRAKDTKPDVFFVFVPAGDHAAAVVLGPDGVLAGRGQPGHRFRWASLTKLATAWTVLIATERRLLDLDEPAGPPGATVRHLLAHASGLPFEGATPIAEPGKRRIYSNTGFEQLAAHVEAAAAMPFAGYLAARGGYPDGAHVVGIEQGYEMGRASQIELTLKISGGKLTGASIAGSAVVVMEGTLEA